MNKIAINLYNEVKKLIESAKTKAIEIIDFKFYKTFEKVNTLYSQLSWNHY